MKIIRHVAGALGVNCYIVYSEEAREAIVVDPGGDANGILRIIEEKDLKVKYIVLTHGHGDHIGAVKDLKEELKAPVLIHEADGEMLEDANKNLSVMMPMGAVEIKADGLLKDGDIIEFGGIEGEIIHTPGHTPGSICIKLDDYLISGDTLFKSSVGRTDFPGGSFDEIIKSIKEKLLVLGDYVQVLPGHGEASTIQYEKFYNPFLA